MDKSDYELLGWLQSDRERVVAHLIDRYSNLLYSVVYRIVRCTDETEDILQETFFQILAKPPRLEVGQTLKPWLCKVAYHRAVNHIKSRERKRKAHEELSGMLVAQQGQHGFESYEEIRMAIVALDEKFRDALLLVWIEGFTHKEAAIDGSFSGSSVLGI